MTSNFDTSDRNAQKGGDFVPRLAMINDIAGFGRCSTTVSLPVISVMKVQVCPVPTSVLSNHLGFPLCHFDDYTSHMRDYIKVWVELGLTFDGLYCGFLGNEEQIDIVREFVEMFRPPLFLLDPVMGDHGRAYSSITETHVQKMKELLPLADIITPNLAEAEVLTGMKITTREEMEKAAKVLSDKLPSTVGIVIKGGHLDDTADDLLYVGGENHWINGKRIDNPNTHGTGCTFSSAIACNLALTSDKVQAVTNAKEYLAGAIAAKLDLGKGSGPLMHNYNIVEKDI